MQTSSVIEWTHLALSMHKKGHTDEEIGMKLRSMGAIESRIQDILQQVKTHLSIRRRNNGFLCCGLGVLLLVVGCMFTLFLFNNGGNIRMVMYGVTSIGLVVTLKGMIDLLGW